MSDHVAKRDLYIGLTKARNKGDVVADEDVKRFGWEKDVEPVKTAAKKETEK